MHARVHRRPEPDAQRDALIRARVAGENIYVDYTSGAKSSRPQ
ncbi:hypothetical protein AB0H34_37375 [Saccharopolyspora shandongensis]